MKIEISANIGDKVYFIKDNKIHNGEIVEIQLCVNEKKEITYNCLVKYKSMFDSSYRALYNQTDLFTSKEELIKTL